MADDNGMQNQFRSIILEIKASETEEDRQERKDLRADKKRRCLAFHSIKEDR